LGLCRHAPIAPDHAGTEGNPAHNGGHGPTQEQSQAESGCNFGDRDQPDAGCGSCNDARIKPFCRLTGGKTRFRRPQGEQVGLIGLLHAIALLPACDESKDAASSFVKIRVTMQP
jgi:hypothetical protein